MDLQYPYKNKKSGEEHLPTYGGYVTSWFSWLRKTSYLSMASENLSTFSCKQNSRLSETKTIKI